MIKNPLGNDMRLGDTILTIADAISQEVALNLNVPQDKLDEFWLPALTQLRVAAGLVKVAEQAVKDGGQNER